MKLKVVIQKAAEGGYRAEVPAIPGCTAHGASLDELIERLSEAVEGCLSTDSKDAEALRGNIVLEPVVIASAELVRVKLAKLGIDEADVKNAIAWARGRVNCPAATPR